MSALDNTAVTLTLLLLFNYVGSIRAQVDCDEYPCFNGGTCVRGSPDSCECPQGFIQPFCYTPCFFCFNGGSCIDDTCQCPPNFAAPTCQSEFAAYLSPLSITVSEGQGRATVQVCRQPSTSNVTLQFSTSASSFLEGAIATEGSDYVNIHLFPGEDVVLVQGQKCTPVSVTLISDSIPETDESFGLVLSAIFEFDVYVVSSHSQSVITITDDDHDKPDNEPPVINNCPDDILVSAEPGSSFTPVLWLPPTATDNLGLVTLTSSHQPGQSFSVGTEIVTYTATDAAGNLAECVFNVSVLIDNEPPVINDCPDDIVVSAEPGSSLTPVFWFPPSATDNLGLVTLTSSHQSFLFLSVGTETVTYTAVDTAGNEAQCVFNVSVLTVTIQCPSTITVPVGSRAIFTNPECIAAGSGTTTPSVSTCSPPSGSSFQFDITVRCTCEMYRKIQCTFMVVVMDNEPPVFIICPDDIIAGVDPGTSSSPVSWISPLATDNVGVVTLTSSHQPGQSFSVGTETTVTCTATDAAGNEAQCVFTVTVMAVTIECPDDMLTQRNSLLMYTSPTCTETGTGVTSGSSCSRQSPLFILSSDLAVTCTCEFYQMVQCTFMVIVEPYLDCPTHDSPVYAGGQLSFSNPSCIFMGRSSPSTCTPSSGSRVFEKTSVTCTCDDHPDAQCTFQVFAQMSCFFEQPCNDNCFCEAGTCSNQPGVCSSECRIYGCPLTIKSKSLSKVNPQLSVDISCTVERSPPFFPSQLDVRLSRSKYRLDTVGLGGISSSGQTGSRRESTATVQNVSEDDIFYCILTMNTDIIGSVNVTGFVYKLPSILDPPTEVTKSTSSITISWRPWDPAIDVGDPPVVAYIPYYRMDPSQDWTNGSVIPVGQPLEYTASNLESDRLYAFSIAVVRQGNRGEGPRGPSLTLKTLCTELIPVSISSSITASNDVSVSWTSPENVGCSTGITQFTVYYDIEGDVTTRQKAGTTDGTTRSFIVDGSLLESGTTYNFYVTVTTDHEGVFSEITEDSQLMFNTDMITETGFSAVYLVVLVVPFLLLCIVVVIIFRRKRRNSQTDDKVEDVCDANYYNVGVTDNEDPTAYIALKEISRDKGSHEYQGISQTSRYARNSCGTDVTSPKAKSTLQEQETEASKHQYEDVDPDDHTAARKLPSVSGVDQQRGDEPEYSYPDMFYEYAGVCSNTIDVVNPSPPTPIKVTDFKSFMKRERSEVIVEIIQQFMALQSGQQHPWDAALKLQNKPKNFFKSLLPYDHSRVKLDTDGSDGSSDYINASYIKNHQGKVSFIAAQGPREGTQDDFWKMIWQEDVEAVVMLVDKTKLTEQQYWPSKVNTSSQYGDMTVLLMESTGSTRRTVRKMNVIKGTNRTLTCIRHYEIPCWRYGGVPSGPADLISVIKEIKTNQKQNKHLLVHCSDGVGATGTFIALYDLMDVIKTKKEVSVFDIIEGMRKDRIDMVSTRLQYLFIFDALFEAMRSPNSQMSCDQLEELDLPAMQKILRKEFQTLKQNHQFDQDLSHMAGSSPENKHKNRFLNLIPMDEYRPVLSSTGILLGSNDYVNATIVKDISGKDFIMTQSPLPSIVEDFWRLVFDYDCTSIIMLNTIDGSDDSLTEYWPEGHSGACSHGLITVTCKKIDKSDDAFTKRQFQVNHKKSQKSLPVDHFSFHGWTGNKPDVSKLIEFIKYTKPQGPGPGLVHCINGVGLSAVYVTVVSELERMEKEDTIDVYGTVKKLRKKCPAAIQTEEEYCFCYKLLKDHLKYQDEYLEVF